WNSISASIAQATSAISGIRRSPPCRTRITEAISAQTTRAVPKSMVIAAMIPPLRPRLALDRRRCCVESADLLRRRRAFGLVERAVDRVAERRVIAALAAGLGRDLERLVDRSRRRARR